MKLLLQIAPSDSIPASLLEQFIELARRKGVTPEALMVEAIEQKLADSAKEVAGQ